VGRKVGGGIRKFFVEHGERVEARVLKNCLGPLAMWKRKVSDSEFLWDWKRKKKLKRTVLGSTE
jgi:hypothetical protein